MLSFDTSMDVFDAFKNYLPCTMLILFPLLLVVSPVNGAQNFPVYRVQHLDLAGSSYGKKESARLLRPFLWSRECV